MNERQYITKVNNLMHSLEIAYKKIQDLEKELMLKTTESSEAKQKLMAFEGTSNNLAAVICRYYH